MRKTTRFTDRWYRAQQAKQIGNCELVTGFKAAQGTANPPADPDRLARVVGHIGGKKGLKGGVPPYDFVKMCVAAGIKAPVPEARFHPTRKWRFDYAWRDERVAMEIEGGIWIAGRHTRGSGAIKDMEKYSEAAILGWRLIYVTPDEVYNNVALDRVRRAILFDPNRR